MCYISLAVKGSVSLVTHKFGTLLNNCNFCQFRFFITGQINLPNHQEKMAFAILSSIWCWEGKSQPIDMKDIDYAFVWIFTLSSRWYN